MFKVERPLFFHHSLPEAPFECHTLESLHELISEVYLPRFDEELAALRRERRAGRPKSKREDELEEVNRREAQEYESGFGKSMVFFSTRFFLGWRLTRSVDFYSLLQRFPT